jgi:hypothetical protein
MEHLATEVVSNKGPIGRRHPFALAFITVVAMFTISTPAVTVFSIPRPMVVAAVATVYLLFSMRARVQTRFWQFALAYLLAFVPGTLYNIFRPNIKATSILQLAVLIVTFCLLATYFQEWLVLNPDRVKVKSLNILLTYIFVVCILELLFTSFFATMRSTLYHSANSTFNEILASQADRDMTIYGGRPMALFSEPSNLAKYLSVIMAAYLTITRCSWKSLFVLVVFFVLSRSVSFFYAGPAMLVALWHALFPGRVFSRKGIRISNKLWVAIAAGAVLVAAVLFTQSSRISSGRQDTSLQSRITLPMQFLFNHPGDVLWGMGLTPQDEVQSYTIMMKAWTHNASYLPGTAEAVSSTVILVAGAGAAGIGVFLVLMLLFQGMSGIWLVVGFMASNFINAGYNAPSTMIPTALLLSLMVYQSRLAQEDRARARANAALLEATA